MRKPSVRERKRKERVGERGIKVQSMGKRRIGEIQGKDVQR